MSGPATTTRTAARVPEGISTRIPTVQPAVQPVVQPVAQPWDLSPEVSGVPNTPNPAMGISGRERAAQNLERLGFAGQAAAARGGAQPFDWNRSEPNNPMDNDLFRYQQNPALWMQRTSRTNPTFANAVKARMSGISDPNAAHDAWSSVWNEQFGAGSTGLAPGQWRNGWRGTGPTRRLY